MPIISHSPVTPTKVLPEVGFTYTSLIPLLILSVNLPYKDS